MTRNGKATSLALAGLAAYAYYKYSKMSSEEKKSFISDIKDKSSGLINKIVPENLRSMFSGSSTESSTTTGRSAQPGFGDTGF